ncbi:MAG TPA: glycosyl hydrolase, partial [Verrucomicrobiae bacterium]|nr:glycosyl hydrolase [Verrucomicrobiae bacterium]
MRRALLIGLLLPALLMVARGGNIQSSNAGLEEGFNHPGDAFRPWVNWFWLDGNITREGITADLEAMAREGIGGAVLMGDVSQEIPAGPVQFDSPEWDALFQHAVRVAARLGLKIRLHNTPGWSGSGGPWITPALSMQKVVWARTNLIGPAHYEGPAPRPLSNLGYEQFIAAEAFPALPGKGGPPPDFHPDIVLGRGAEGAANALLDDNPATTVRFDHPSERSPAFIELRFGAPFAASRLILQSHGGLRQAQGRLEVSDDGGSFHKVRDFLGNAGELELNFELVQARRFRIAFTSPPLNSRFVDVSGIQLAAVYQLEHHQGKTGMTRVPPPPLKHPRVPFSAMVHETNMIDLSSKVTATGRLEWDVPPGVWTVVTFASAPVGMTNHPPTPRGLGLECDKLSKVAIETHFDAFLKKEIAAAGDNAGKAFSGAHIDSWEVGLQNWTADFPQEFQKRRGYSLLPFLPAYAGEIVESPQICDRFFWDVRRTIAELEADNYAGALAELVHRYGMKLSIEAYGNGPFNDLLYASKADVPMGEFWTERENAEKFAQCKSMAAAAHVFGKPIVDVEAFTSFPSDSSWQCHPFSLKPLADTALCNGVTRFVFHCYAHQPWLDLKPGMTMGSAGAHYDRNNTWWNYSRPWHEYIARCQFLLRQGRFKADICYVTPEGAYFSPPTRHTLNPPLPDGYDYDVAPPEALFSRFSVAN